MNTMGNNEKKINVSEVTPPYPDPDNTSSAITTDEITPPFPGSPAEDEEPVIK